MREAGNFLFEMEAAPGYGSIRSECLPDAAVFSGRMHGKRFGLPCPQDIQGHSGVFQGRSGEWIMLHCERRICHTIYIKKERCAKLKK